MFKFHLKKITHWWGGMGWMVMGDQARSLSEEGHLSHPIWGLISSYCGQV